MQKQSSSPLWQASFPYCLNTVLMVLCFPLKPELSAESIENSAKGSNEVLVTFPMMFLFSDSQSTVRY